MIQKMKAVFDRYTIYDFSDEAIILELCKKKVPGVKELKAQ